MYRATISAAVLLTFTTLAGTHVPVYDTYYGYHVLSGILENITCNDGPCTLYTCNEHCMCHATCAGANFNKVTKECQLHDASIFTDANVESYYPEWVVVEPRAAPPEFGDWKLVFRGTSGINQSVYDTYMNTSHHDDSRAVVSDMPRGCLSVNGSLPCDRHYRSWFLDLWASRPVLEVFLGYYINGVCVANVTFDGVGSNVTSWFDISRVMTSSWIDLNSTTNVLFFSIVGHSDIHRRFFIQAHYGGCGSDRGWAVAVDDPNGVGCPWNAVVSGYPAFLVSGGGTATDQHLLEFLRADVMAIMVKEQQ